VTDAIDRWQHQLLACVKEAGHFQHQLDLETSCENFMSAAAF